MQKHASWVIALIVGLAIGVVGDRMAGGGGGAAGKKPSDLPAGSLREADLPPGTLAGLSDAQKYQVLKGVGDKFGAAARPPQRPVEDSRAVYRIPLDDSPVKGPADALVTIVESSDFQCPFCKRVLPTLKQIEEAYSGKVRFAFKHNPLPFHDKAMISAMAAEEARAQGGDAKFWAMHDRLFDLSPALDRAALEKAAADLKLDVAAFRKALDGSKWESRIKRDQALVTSVGATGTPAFFINGRKVSGAVPFESFKAVIDEELRKAEDAVKAGTPAKDLYARIVEKGASAPVMMQGAAPPQPPAAPPQAPAPQVAKVTFRPDDPVRGPQAAKVTIVLFSDFQCPFCSRVEPTLKQVQDTYGKDVRVVWKHQPLPFHPNAMPAAEAAEAAREQGKFWQMHDLLFANQQELSPAKYEEWARKIGLDLARFKASIDSHRNRARIEEDAKLGNSVGANGTPTLFLNCRQVVGAQPFDAFKRVIDEEIRKADDLAKKGVKIDAGYYERICQENVKMVAAAAPAAPSPAAAPAPEVVSPSQLAIRPDDPVRWNPRAPVAIVVFSDFQCPFCSRVEPTLKQIESKYGDKVKLVWKHEPLPFHPNAMPAAEAAEAAREQGKFWQMHDLLFANQQELSPAKYEAWAKQIGLDLGKFKQSVEAHRNKARIDEDLALAQKLGANGTPAFFVNGEKLMGAQPFEAFQAVIDRQLQKVAQK